MSPDTLRHADTAPPLEVPARVDPGAAISESTGASRPGAVQLTEGWGYPPAEDVDTWRLICCRGEQGHLGRDSPPSSGAPRPR